MWVLIFEQAVIDAVYDIFATMITMTVVAGEPVLNSKQVIPANISGSIGFVGDVSGVLVVHCPAKTALAITEDFLGMTVEDLDDDVRDAVGEIANMVAGGFKTSLARDGISLNVSIPTTVIGKGYRVAGASQSQRIILPFTCGQHDFWVELRYQKAISC